MIRALKDLTDELWIVDDTGKDGDEPLGQTRKREAKEQVEKLRAHPAFEHPLLRDGAEFIEFIETPPISTPDAPVAEPHEDEPL
jgi:DNA polymerase-3 subunit gamma/tau